MGQTLSVDLVLNAMGFRQGITEAQKATADYTNATKISDTQIKQLNRAMKQAQQETKALAIAFNSLSKAEQESAQGQALQRQMQEAMQEAARLKDTVDDTTAAIKAMASDTAGLDALKEGLDIGKSAAIAYAGAIAKLTGDEQSLKDVTATLAMIEGGFSAAIKISNALQKQSAIMTGIMNVQRKAAAAAIALETKSTIGATAAQRIFNAVAKANPYVLLASVAAAAAVAIGGYMLATKKTADEEKKQQTELSKSQQALQNIANQYTSTYASALASTLVKYNQLRTAYSKLTSDHQRTQWIKDNKEKFKELGLAVNDITTAENVFKNNTTSVVNAFKLRAQAAAEAARLESLYAQKIEAEENTRKKTSKQFKAGDKVQASDVERYGLQEGTDYNYASNGIEKVFTNEGAIKANAESTKRAISTATSEIDKQIEDSANRLTKATEDYNKSLGNLGAAPTGDTSKVTKEQQTQLQKLQAEVDKYKKQLENVDIKAPNAQETINAIKESLKGAEQALKDYRVAIGLDVPKSKLAELKEQLAAAQAQLPFAISEEDVAAAHAKIDELKGQVEAEEVRLSIKVEPEVDMNKVTNDISDIMSSLQPQTTFDISSLTGDAAKQAEEDLAALERYQDALKNLNALMNEASASDFQISAAQDGINELLPMYDELIAKAQQWAEENQKAADMEKNIQKTQQAMQTLGQIGQSVGSMFSALGQITGNEGFAVAGIVAQAIAQIALGYATATSQAGSMGPWAWIAFAVTGLATMISMIASIKQQTSGYATGGVITGNHFVGDQQYARVNAGEMILNQAQQARLFNLANGQDIANNITPAVQTANVAITSTRVQGSDIVLAIKNQGKLDHKKYLND